jgi:undecaprenyl-diphosphatase
VRRPTTRWAGLVTLILAAGVLIGIWSGAGLLLGRRTSATERGWLGDIEQGRSSAVTETAKVLSTIGSAAVLIPVTLVVALVLVLRRLVAVAGFVVTVLVGGIELPNIVKSIVGRPRPPVADRLVSVASTSFPSGHAAQNAAILPALALAAAALGANRRVSLALAVAGAVLVGLSRNFLGVHYPSDVLAGWLLGATWVAACWWALRPSSG